MREEDAIHAARRAVPILDAIRGPGDDAAVLHKQDSELAWAIDLLIEGRHFLRSISSLADAAFKAVARNASDLAAMGADPVGFLAGVTIPDSDPATLSEISEGLAAASKAFGLPIAGGDLSRSETVMFAVTVLGRLSGAGLGRDGARPGDLLAVTGRLGAAAAGLELHRRMLDGDLAAQRILESHPHLSLRHRRGTARLDVSPMLREFATSCIDVSDGLVADLEHVARASQVTIVVDPSLVPLDARVAETAEFLAREPFELATAGDDYELAFTAPADADLAQVDATVIGRVESGPASVVTLGDVVSGGHDHFA